MPTDSHEGITLEADLAQSPLQSRSASDCPPFVHEGRSRPRGREGGPDVLGLSYMSQPAARSSASTFESAFPSNEVVSRAWENFPRVDESDKRLEEEPEGFSFELRIGPGVVSLGVSSPARAERAAERELKRHMTAVNAEAAWLESTGEWTGEKLQDREITGWSARSRSRMILSLAQTDFSPLFESGWPAMVTLTLPGCWLSVAPTGQAFKVLFDRFRKRFQRAWNETLRCVWKLEFQGRSPRARCTCTTCADTDDGRAPHLHLFMTPPSGYAATGEPLPFTVWLSRTWAAVVNHPDHEQRRRHELAGTAVDYREGLSARDPKRLAVYFSKHNGAGGGKEYQHNVPVAWTKPGAGPGRFWGVMGLEKSVSAVRLSKEDFLTVRRILRRWSRSQVFYGEHGTSIRPRLRSVRVQRTDTRTGAIRLRTSKKRVALFSQGALVGGFATVIDGPRVAKALSMALGYCKEPE